MIIWYNIVKTILIQLKHMFSQRVTRASVRQQCPNKISKNAFKEIDVGCSVTIDTKNMPLELFMLKFMQLDSSSWIQHKPDNEGAKKKIEQRKRITEFNREGSWSPFLAVIAVSACTYIEIKKWRYKFSIFLLFSLD